MLDKLNAVQAFAVSVWAHEMPAVVVSTAITGIIAVQCQQYLWTSAAALQRCMRHTVTQASSMYLRLCEQVYCDELQLRKTELHT
jgi:hypothetical protein